MMDKEVKVIAMIRKNTTGEIREYRTEVWLFDDEEGVPDSYMWSEGNYSCDCNRGLFFARAGREEENWHLPCGNELYSVNLKTMDRKIFYKEYEED